MESKKSGEKRGKGAVRLNTGEVKSNDPGDQKEGRGGAVKFTYPAQPSLDFSNSMMLDGKNDKVEELDCITVKFFPGKMMEITYEVRSDPLGGPIKMSPSAFAAFLRKKKAEKAKEHEGTEAVGYRNKMMKRILVAAPPDIPGVRAAMALALPPLAATVMGFTQHELQSHKLNSPEEVLSYWNKAPSGTKEEMDRLQEAVLPGAKPWTERLDEMTAEATSKRMKAEAKKVAKTFNAPLVVSGGSESGGGNTASTGDPPGQLSWATFMAQEEEVQRLKAKGAETEKKLAALLAKAKSSGE